MLNINHNLSSPVRKIKGKAELFNSSAVSVTGENIFLNDVFPQRHKINCVVRSRNYIYYPYYNVSGNINGITYTINADNTITANGTATEDSFFYMVQTMSLPKGTYTLSSDNLTNNNELRCAIYNKDNTLDRYVYNGTFTINSEKLVYVYLVILKGNTVNNITFNPMLEKGTYPSGYSKYITDLTKIKLFINEVEYTPNANGVVDNVYSISPYMSFDVSAGAVIEVEYKNYEYVKDFTYRDHLKSFTIERVGDGSKFFGYGICQKINVKLMDKDREIKTTTDNSFRAYLTTGDEYVSNFPTFYITENHRDENTNELSITAYDALYGLSEHFWNEIDSDALFYLKDYAEAVCAFLKCSMITNVADSFKLAFDGEVNLEGTETLREVLDAIAEATQTIYYLDSNNNLVFKRFDKDGAPVLTIGKSDYYTLDSKDNRRLSKIVSATELGDDLYASLLAAGTTQYIRNNPFWDLREDRAQLVDAALDAIGGLTINQFECDWRGNYLLELGDKLGIITKDNEEISTYLLDEVLEYNGFLSSKLRWAYENNEAETPANPTNLGESLKQTFARVDKANKQIELVVSDVEEMSQLQMTTNSIVASVSDEVENLTQKVEAQITKEDVKILIQEMSDFEVNEVTTTTGFTFNADGLTVSKSGSEMTTQITEDGMRINKGNEEVLKVDNVGVKAEDLHAITYLIIGKNSRLEDYIDNRTGCFWIG